MLRVRVSVIAFAMLIAMMIVSSAFASISITNSSFEADAVGNAPGYCATISGWTTTDGGHGLNNAAICDFADNGIVPDGKNVAFIQNAGSLSQDISGLEAGKTYELVYRENSRAYSIAPIVNVTLGSETIVDDHPVIPVETAGSHSARYAVVTARFTVPASGTYTLSFNSTSNEDNTVLLDAVTIREVDPYSLSVKNPSFEYDVVGQWPGYCSLSGWDALTLNIGINSPATCPFADNGRIPDGNNVAFIQTWGTLSQFIDGFEGDATYILKYRENARASSEPPLVSALLDDYLPVVEEHTVMPTNGEYNTRAAIFTAPYGGTLKFSFLQNNYNDSSVLLDDVEIIRVGDAGEALGILTGTVTDAGTGSPLSGATITCASTGESVTTDSDGVYTLVAPSGSQLITAQYQDAKQTVTVVITSAATTNQDFQFTPAAVYVRNSSFEDDIVPPYPGYGNISSWARSSAIIGMNNASTTAAFADNGNIPDGQNVAFIQHDGNIKQSIDGFEAGATYIFTYRENARAYSDDPEVSVTLDDITVIPAHSFGPTYGDYYSRAALFITPTAGTHTLSMNQLNLSDSAVLLDDIHIIKVGAGGQDLGIIKGNVTSSATGSPVAGAVITCASTGSVVTTDADGAYTMVVPGGSQTLTATYRGMSETRTVTAVTAELVTQNFVFEFPSGSISDIKSLDDGKVVVVTDSIVTGVYDGLFYIEDKDRCTGIKVISNASVKVNDVIGVMGTLGTQNGEKYLGDASVTTASDSSKIAPLGMNNRAVGGTLVTGLLAKTWGKVTGIAEDGSYAYIDDGSGLNDGNAEGFTGIRVILAGTSDLGLPGSVKLNDNMSVAGVVGREASGVVIRPRSAMDVTDYQDEHTVVHASDFGVANDGSDKLWRTQVISDSATPVSAVEFTSSGIKMSYAGTDTASGIRCKSYAGLPLSDLTELKFGEFVNTAPTMTVNRTLNMVLNVDINDDGALDYMLAYEPYYHQSNTLGGVQGTWQVWDAFNGLWTCWDANDGTQLDGMTRDNPGTLSYFLSKYPNAKIDSGANGGLRLYTGFYDVQICDGFVCTLGNLTVGTINGGTKVYSFEP